ncbi:UDP-N-acetylmuramoyl-L-alanyl-D-glutamate--2,6-diaminopimelate ligase, partial [Candidatus Aerophobetes bacterium]|nr:UDP-N-acetylmuramoyl-L-alanyl-D-glutamate--2,6-diaminopimelate ligase [Candidatus Aerophobetes bacterium]
FARTTLIKVVSTRRALAKISNIFYDYPSQKIKIAGVTGTKGKTTITYFLQSVFRKAGVKSGRLSTINYDLGGEIIPALTTTPESVDLQKFLRKMIDNQVKYVFMEVSSHSLVLHRVEGVEFGWAIFTNLSPEHLDFHKKMEDYLRAKLVLFEMMLPQNKALINVDDDNSEKIIRKTSCQVITYGIRKQADFRASNLRMEKRKVFFHVKINGEKEEFEIKIPGVHNVYNALAAIGVATEEGISSETIRKGLQDIEKIPGRLELIENKANLNIYVDYAHTPSSLEKAISTLKNLTSGKVIVVFGCGGDRDPYKRPAMGRIAFKMADFAVVTSDNPRSESPEAIILDIERGMLEEGAKKGKDYISFVDRKEAIEYALSNLRCGDTLLVAGKGHESIQIFKDKVVPFDDRVVICQLLRKTDLL